jgi:hypothetical protein
MSFYLTNLCNQVYEQEWISVQLNRADGNPNEGPFSTPEGILKIIPIQLQVGRTVEYKTKKNKWVCGILQNVNFGLNQCQVINVNSNLCVDVKLSTHVRIIVDIPVNTPIEFRLAYGDDWFVGTFLNVVSEGSEWMVRTSGRDKQSISVKCSDGGCIRFPLKN